MGITQTEARLSKDQALNAQKKRLTMTIISGPVKPVDYHPDASQPTAANSASVSIFSKQAAGNHRNLKGLAKKRR
jgi:hypothetical protein